MIKKNYALIPAKLFSKRLKNKNLLKINNKTLIEIAINSAKKNKLIHEIFVSTNSKKIINLSNSFGVKSILRDKKYKISSLPASSVVSDFINQVKPKKNSIIVYLQPTSPLRNFVHVKKALKKFLKSKNKTILISFKKDNKNILKSFYKNKNQIIPLMDENSSNLNIKDLPDVLSPNGAIYIFKIKDFLKKKKFPNKKILPFLMNQEESVDIDEMEDFIKAKNKFKNIKNET